MIRNLGLIALAASLSVSCRSSKDKSQPQPIPTPTPSAMPAPGKELFLNCDTTNRTLHWAQYAVDADLMQAFSAEQGIKLQDQKVAIIDSGFTPSFQNQFQSPVLMLKAEDATDAPESDSSGHGTFIAGLIAARDVGLAPGVSLASYKLGKKEGYYDYATVYQGALKACREGYKIINVSQGYPYYESGKIDENALFKAELDEMKAKGCLMVKAAGNGSYSDRASLMNKDNAVLLVEAASVARERSEFSSDGEIRAPGSLVASLKVYDQGIQTCSGQSFPANVSSGTSFATPIAVGILAHVRGHLAQSAEFQALPPEQQVNVLSRILEASTLSGLINGYRAVLIAHHWRPEATTVKDLQGLIDTSCETGNDIKSCDAGSDIKGFLGCSAPLRRRLAVCSQTLENKDIVPFFQGLAIRRSSDLWLNYAPLFPKPEILQPTAANLTSMWTRSMPSAQGSEGSTNWLEAHDLVKILDILRSTGTLTSDFLEHIFLSASLLQVLDRAPGRDIKLQEALQTAVQKVQDEHPDLMVDAMGKAYDRWHEAMEQEAKGWNFRMAVSHSLARIRLFNLLDTVLPESQKAELGEQERRFMKGLQDQFDETDHVLYGLSTSVAADLWLEESLYAWDANALASFYERRGLRFPDTESPEAFDRVPTSAVIAWLGLERQAIIDQHASPDRTLILLRVASQRPVWRVGGIYSANTILKAALQNLELAWRFAPAQGERITRELNGIIENAGNTAFRMALLQKFYLLGNRFENNGDGTYNAIPISNLISAETRQSLAVKLLAELPRQTPEAIASYIMEWDYFFFSDKELLPRKAWQSIAVPTAWQAAAWHSAYANRFDHLQSPLQDFAATPGQTLPSLLNEAAISILQAIALDIQNFSGYRPLTKISLLDELPTLDQFCSTADKPRLNAAVQRMLRAIDTARNGKFYQHLKPKLHGFQAQCLQLPAG